jgi:hypothetical protein
MPLRARMTQGDAYALLRKDWCLFIASRRASRAYRAFTTTTMRALTLLLTAAPAALAVPSSEFQVVLNNVAQYTEAATGGLFGTVSKGLAGAVEAVEAALASSEDGIAKAGQWAADELAGAEQWADALGRQFVKQNGLICAYCVVSCASAPPLSLRAFRRACHAPRIRGVLVAHDRANDM